MPPSEDLRWLVGSRWFIPVLATADRDGGVRFAALVGSLNISRSMLAAALEQLVARGWLVRNPGHGHPLRPEYVPSDEGRPIAAWCGRVVRQRGLLGIRKEELGRWSLPLIRRLDRRPERFSTLEADLAPISPRSLSLGLKQLVATGLAARRLEESFPPSAIYGLTTRGQGFAAAIR